MIRSFSLDFSRVSRDPISRSPTLKAFFSSLSSKLLRLESEPRSEKCIDHFLFDHPMIECLKSLQKYQRYVWKSNWFFEFLKWLFCDFQTPYVADDNWTFAPAGLESASENDRNTLKNHSSTEVASKTLGKFSKWFSQSSQCRARANL